MSDKVDESNDFMENIHNYKSVCALTSDAQISPPPAYISLCFKIHGDVYIYHCLGTLHLSEGIKRKYALNQKMRTVENAGCL
jgi:hypothetical protein